MLACFKQLPGQSHGAALSQPRHHFAVAPAGPGADNGGATGALMDFDITLDCEGLLCPLPVLKASKRLMTMAPGQVLRVVASDRMAAIDLPHFCGEAGHDYLGAQDEGAATAHFLRRGGSAQ